MSPEKIQDFVKALIKCTEEKSVKWDYTDIFLDLNSQDIPEELQSFEFNLIDFHRSYACQTNAGVVYLNYVRASGGKGDEDWEGFELILHPRPYKKDHYHRLLENSGLLYTLETKINKYKSKLFSPEDDEFFIDLFLRSCR